MNDIFSIFFDVFYLLWTKINYLFGFILDLIARIPTFIEGLIKAITWLVSVIGDFITNILNFFGV